MKSLIISGLAAFSIAAVPAAQAQTALPANEFGLVVFGNKLIRISDADATSLEIETHHRLDYTVSSASWLKPVVEHGKLILNVDANNTSGSRTAVLSVTTSSGATAEMTVTQSGINVGEIAAEAVAATKAKPSSAEASVSQGGEGPEYTIDGNVSTKWHSPYAGFDPENPAAWPVLTYRFNQATDIAAARYYPRQDGSTNGNWGNVKVYLSHTANNWEPMSDGRIFSLGESSSPYTFAIPEDQQKGLLGVRFEIQSGANDSNNGRCFASCAEMEFMRPDNSDNQADMALFTDNILSAIKPGVKDSQIENMSNPFLKEMARLMKAGTYSSEGLVSEIEPLWNVETLSEQWNAPGKYYDRTQGATGAMLSKGKYAVMVEGIPEHKGGSSLKVVGWYAMPDDPDSKGYLSEETFAISNGLNVIDRSKSTFDGLAYIDNYDTEGMTSGKASPIKVHIIGAAVNGVLSNTKTNAEMQQILDNAVYPCIDLMGSRVHSVWEVDAIKRYARDQYVRYINTLDQLIIWEHRLLGFEKYNRVPPNKTLAYVNYDYYMYQGGRGVTFKYDTQYRVCSPDVLITQDDDAIWGLSHEWGHQHQMKPYFCWTGMAEVSNNIFSAYNVAHMGYPIAENNYWGRYPKDKWTVTAQRIFLDDNYDRTATEPDASGETKTANSDGIVMACRPDGKTAAQQGRAFWWSDELKNFAINQPMKPTLRSENAKSAINAIEAYSSNNGELIFAPYINMMYFFMEDNSNRSAADARPDLMMDLFESLRLNDDPDGSTVEKKNGVDKYELLASIFNGNRSTDASINKTAQFKKLFPGSCWVKNGYLPEENNPVSWDANSAPFIINLVRKASRLTGYNLWSYFERWGVFTVAAIEQGDYGIQHYIFTEAMYDEFKADMQALETSGELRPLPEAMRAAMSTCPAPQRQRPVIPNDRPLTADEN